MAEVQQMPIEPATNGIAEPIIEQIEQKLKISEEVAEEEAGDNTAVDNKQDEQANGDIDQPNEQPSAKPEISEEQEEPVNTSTSDASTAKMEEKDSSLSKKQSQKSLFTRLRSWWMGMFSVKGEQPGSVTKVFSNVGTNLRNSLRRTKSPKKEKKSKEAICEEQKEAIEEDKISKSDSVLEEAKQEADKVSESEVKIEEEQPEQEQLPETARVEKKEDTEEEKKEEDKQVEDKPEKEEAEKVEEAAKEE